MLGGDPRGGVEEYQASAVKAYRFQGKRAKICLESLRDL